MTDGRDFDESDPRDAKAVRYARADSDYALRMYYLFNQWFGRYLPKRRFVVEQIELPAAVYICIMKYNELVLIEQYHQRLVEQVSC